MSSQVFDRLDEKGPAQSCRIDESKLALLAARPYWQKEEAEQVLFAQMKSGQNIRQFAMRYGLTAHRLYHWKKRLGPGLWVGEHAQVDEPEPELSASVCDAKLDLENPEERYLHQYLERATLGTDPTWRLFHLRRQGPLLLCVVLWAKWEGDSAPYSLVTVDLTELSVRWHDYPTLRDAREALYGDPGKKGAQDGSGRLPSLVKVELRTEADGEQPECPLKMAADPQRSHITVWLPSGVRIEIPTGVPKDLISTVLGVMRAQPC